MSSWLLSAFMHCPDRLSRISSYGVDPEYDQPDEDQQILVGVADRKACQDGYVLLIAVNHKGQILPYRVRKRAAFIFLLFNEWDEDGIELREIFAQVDHANEEEEFYLEDLSCIPHGFNVRDLLHNSHAGGYPYSITITFILALSALKAPHNQFFKSITFTQAAEIDNEAVMGLKRISRLVG
ncbi:hypothetical protein BJX65DRAFT_312490 [Aspergillus insuetus]